MRVIDALETTVSVLVLHVGKPASFRDPWDHIRSAPLRRAVCVAGDAKYGPDVPRAVAVEDAALSVLTEMDRHVLVIARLEPSATDADRAIAEQILARTAPHGCVVDATVLPADDEDARSWQQMIAPMTVVTLADSGADTLRLPRDEQKLIELVTGLARAIDGNRRLDEALHRQVTREENVIFEEVDLVADLVLGGPAGVLIDVGAHHGTSARRFADAGWKVLAFEPDPENRAVLEQSLGSRVNVTIDPRALGAEPKQGVQLFRSDQSTGITSLSAFHETHVEGATVDVSTVTDVCAAAGIEAVDFLKIDVEGHDLDVLRGTDLTALAPRVIVAEFEDHKTRPMGHGVEDIAEHLVSHGYEVWCSEWHPIIRYGIRHQWRGIEAWPCTPSPDSWGNLIAFREPVDRATMVSAVAGRLGIG